MIRFQAFVRVPQIRVDFSRQTKDAGCSVLRYSTYATKNVRKGVGGGDAGSKYCTRGLQSGHVNDLSGSCYVHMLLFWLSPPPQPNKVKL